MEKVKKVIEEMKEEMNKALADGDWAVADVLEGFVGKLKNAIGQGYSVSIVSSVGKFEEGQEIVLTAKVFWEGTEVTDQVVDNLIWRRYSGDNEADLAWSKDKEGVSSIVVPYEVFELQEVTIACDLKEPIHET